MAFTGYITAAGRAFQAEVLANGGQMAFTRAAGGSGTTANPANATAMANEQCEFLLKYSHNVDDRIEVFSTLDNGTVSAPFVWREWGLFASDAEREVLYLISQDVQGQTISLSGDVVDYKHTIIINDDLTVTVEAAPFGPVTQGDIGRAFGIAPLDAEGKVPLEHLPPIDAGGVKTVNGVEPDEDGDVTLGAGDVGAAEAVHAHNAADITAGMLPLARGGTGASTAANARTALGAAATAHTHAGTDIASGTIAAARLPAASTTAAGILRLATDAEASAGTLTTVAVTPRQLYVATVNLLSLVLYENGNINPVVTNFIYGQAQWSQFRPVTFTKGTTYMSLLAVNGQRAAIGVTSNSIDLANWNRLEVTLTATGGIGGSVETEESLMGASVQSNTTEGAGSLLASSNVFVPYSLTNHILSVDISAVSSGFCAFGIVTTGSPSTTRNFEVKCTRMVLKR